MGRPKNGPCNDEPFVLSCVLCKTCSKQNLLKQCYFVQDTSTGEVLGVSEHVIVWML